MDLEKQMRELSKLSFNGQIGVSTFEERVKKYAETYHNLQLHKTQVSGSFIQDSEKLTNDIIKYFPKFFDDFTNFEYGTGRDAGKDFKKIYNKAKRLKTKIGKNYR